MKKASDFFTSVCRYSAEQGMRVEVTPTFADFPGRPTEGYTFPDVAWESIGEAYGLSRTGWKEVVINVQDPTSLTSGNSRVPCNLVLSYDIQAWRESRITVDRAPFNQLVGIGVLEAVDGRIVTGLRGGEVTTARVERTGVTKYGAPPSGHVTYQADEDPLRSTMRVEFMEEIGGTTCPLTSIDMLGVIEAKLPGPNGIRLVHRVSTSATARELIQLNVEARCELTNLLKTIPRPEAEARLAEQGYPPHAWEHEGMVSLANEPAAIQHFVDGRIADGTITGIGVGALLTYKQWLEEN